MKLQNKAFRRLNREKTYQLLMTPKMWEKYGEAESQSMGKDTEIAWVANHTTKQKQEPYIMSPPVEIDYLMINLLLLLIICLAVAVLVSLIWTTKNQFQPLLM